MQTCICLGKGLYVFKGLSLVSEFLRDHPTKSAVIFCSSRHQSQHFRDHLEILNKLKLNINVLHINGLLHKTDKFWRICLFCDEGHIREADFWVLVTTNAANVGINKSQIALQVQFDWPRDLLTYFQECGRGSRLPGVRSTCIRAPQGARTYPWILSKYFPSVRVSVPPQISIGCVYFV